MSNALHAPHHATHPRVVAKRGPEQQVNVQATIILSLPIAWDEDEISTHIRCSLGSAFQDDLPGEIDGESPVNFDFQQEAEIYGTRGCDNLPNRLQTHFRRALRGIRRFITRTAGMRS
jgi:hypothetical protein